jgi:integrase
MSMCGLRRGEACGLAWDDLDLDGGSPTSPGISSRDPTGS